MGAQAPTKILKTLLRTIHHVCTLIFYKYKIEASLSNLLYLRYCFMSRKHTHSLAPRYSRMTGQRGDRLEFVPYVTKLHASTARSKVARDVYEYNEMKCFKIGEL